MRTTFASRVSRWSAKGPRYERLKAQVFAEETHCWICQRWVDQALPPRTRWSRSLDHVVPVSRGGDPYARSNARLAHLCCNTSRGNGTPGVGHTSQRW